MKERSMAESEAGGPPDTGRVLAELRAVGELPNSELLSALDLVLVEVERRLLHYAKAGPEVLQMADEGLVLAARAGARLRQALSASTHAAAHLQLVGVGEWRPKGTNPSWSDDSRITGSGD
jgi:hypothetical protein